MLNTGPWYRRPDAPLLVGHLMASAPPRSRAANAGASALSILLHASLLTVAVLLVTGHPPRAVTRPSPIDIILPSEAPPEPVPPPPAVLPPDAGATGAAAPPAGFPTLTAPTVVLPDIPPIRAGVATNEALWNAWGPPGGSESGPRPGGSGSGAQPDISSPESFVPVAVAPVLQNREAVQRALARAYPAMLRDAAMGGRVLVWVLVDERGQVMKVQLKQSSGMAALDDAALGVARTMRFSPGINHDIPVKVWVAVPVDFRVER